MSDSRGHGEKEDVEGLQERTRMSDSQSDGEKEEGVESLQSLPGPTQKIAPTLTRPSFERRLLLFSTYALSMFGLNSAPLLYPSMEADGLFDQAGAARILGLQTAGTAIGKLFAGPLADAMGGRRTYLIAVSLLFIFVCFMSIAETSWIIGLAAFMMEFSSTPVWPSHARMIHGWFPRESISEGFWVLSMSSRGGNMAAGIVFGKLISNGVHWRWVLRLAAACCVVGVVLDFFFHKDSTQNVVQTGSPPEIARICKEAREILTHKHFWTAVGCQMPATVVKRMGQAVSIFLFSNAANILDKGTAASFAVIFQAGLLTSVIVFGGLYTRMAARNQRNMLLCLGFLSAISAMMLAVISNTECKSMMDVIFRLTLLFLIALGIGCSYYIPAGIFSVSFGGSDSTGTVSAFMDVMSWTMAASFLVLQSWVIDSPMGWSGVWSLVSLAALICVFTTHRLQLLLQSGRIKCLGESNHGTSTNGPGKYSKLTQEEAGVAQNSSSSGDFNKEYDTGGYGSNEQDGKLELNT